MFEFPDLKSEKNFDLLNDQPEVNNNNNILDITNNANSVASASTAIKSPRYANILKTQNKILEKNFSIDEVYFSDFSIETNSANINNDLTNIKIKFAPKKETKKNNLDETISDFSISNSFLEKIKNTTYSDFENIWNDNIVESAEILQNTSSDFSCSKLEINAILDIINAVSSIKLSTSSIISKSEKTSEIIENIEIEKEFVEKVKEIESLIDNELINEIDNSQDSDTTSISENEDIKSNSSIPESTQTSKKLLSKDSYEEKLYKIENAIEDNKTLLISERLGKIYLPYQKSELEIYMKKNSNLYKSLQEVVTEKFVLPFEFFKNQSLKSRFSETYNLLKNRDGQTFMKSVSYAFKISGKRNLNPTIIASCKSKYELDSYIYYLDSNTLSNFRFFDIIYEVNPLKK